MRMALIIVATLVATSAFAQNSTTTCREFAGAMKCETESSPTGSAYQDAYERSLRAGERRMEGLAGAIQRRNAEMDENMDRVQRQHVGLLISRGDCEGAWRYSLAAGRFDLVDLALKMCKPPAE